MLFEGGFDDFTILTKVFKYKYLHMINHKQFKHIYLFRYRILIALVALITMIENEDASIDHTLNSKKKTSVQILRLISVT